MDKEIKWRTDLYWKIFAHQQEVRPFFKTEDLIQVTNAIYEKWTLDDLNDNLGVITEEILKDKYGKA